MRRTHTEDQHIGWADYVARTSETDGEGKDVVVNIYSCIYICI